MRNRRRYGKDWQKRARAAKEEAGWICTKCGVCHGALRWSKWSQREYPVYLQAHHPDNDPENPNARLTIVCPSCHYHHFHKTGRVPIWVIRAEAEARLHRKLIAVAYVL